MTPPRSHSFTGQRAVILHRSEDVFTRLSERLAVLGVTAVRRWPALEAGDAGADLLLVDVDQAHDDQFPWPAGREPVPAVALIGSESPGRLAWALERRMHAYLPLAAMGNVYSALVVAVATFARQADEARREAETARRAGLRLEVIRAVLALMRAEGLDEAAALKQLRALAMVERVPLEDAAQLYLGERSATGQAQA